MCTSIRIIVNDLITKYTIFGNNIWLVFSKGNRNPPRRVAAGKGVSREEEGEERNVVFCHVHSSSPIPNFGMKTKPTSTASKPRAFDVDVISPAKSWPLLPNDSQLGIDTVKMIHDRSGNPKLIKLGICSSMGPGHQRSFAHIPENPNNTALLR